MSYIDFQSSRKIEDSREALRNSREAVLRKAEADYYKRKDKKDRNNAQPMLPSLEKQLDEQNKKKKKKKKKSRRKSSSSSSSQSESDGDEWVEKPVTTHCGTEKQQVHHEKLPERDEWMTLPGTFATVSREELRKQSDRQRQKDLEAEKRRKLLDNPGQTDRELNPYWKDGGTGLPENTKPSLELTSHSVGDYGADWLRRALRRAKEQAEEEKRSLEDVVSERWGSLQKLESMIEEAEKKEGRRSTDRNKYYKRDEGRRYHSQYSSKEKYNKDDGRGFKKELCESRYSSEDRPRFDSHRNRFRKPEEYESESRFQKPSEYDKRTSSSQSAQPSWKKKPAAESDRNHEKCDTKYPVPSKWNSSASNSESDNEVDSSKNTTTSVLTDKEMNELGAKIVKAEILGNKSLAAELKKKLEDARALRSKAQSEKVKNDEEEEVVLLTKTNSKGLTRPLQEVKHPEPQQGRRKKQKVETHVDGNRVRYYADDDKWSLQDMFQQEKMTSSTDMNEEFSRLVAKGARSGKGNDNNMDDLFEESARLKESDGKMQARERNNAIYESRKMGRAMDNCAWCLESSAMSKHLLVAIGTKCYLCLPPYESLTTGHCLIIPSVHITCATQLDEDVWEEMQNFRRALTKMFLKRNEDVLFFEVAMNFRYHPHMVLHCIPLPKEVGDLAPIYFKKAILECEMEWATNKKLVNLAKRNVRLAIPKGLPYFFVDFGLEGGFAHVIEDEKIFPKNFAQEIIGGMLDLHHSKWRKPRMENFDNQRKKVFQFAEWWKAFDFTHGNKRRDSSDSD